MKEKVKLAIFASGSGSNAENIYHYFYNHPCVVVSKIYTNNKEAGVIERFKDKPITVDIFSAKEFRDSSFISKLEGIDFIVLAGFLLLVPSYLIQAFPVQMVNIHPALLPKYGGKGMYGMHVHEAVIAAGEKESGITIHRVNEEFDKGEILFQAKVEIEPQETKESLANKIHVLEYQHFPAIIEKTIKDIFKC